jgi:hypothetical protein
MRRVVLGNPFLLLGIVSYLFFQAWLMAPGVRESVVIEAVFSMAHLYLWPFRQIATWINPHLRGFPEWVDIAGTGLLGAMPYILADLALRRTWRTVRGSAPGEPLPPEAGASPRS